MSVVMGVTGSRHGVTRKQLASLTQLFEVLPVDEMRHGDCLGADQQSHYCAVAFGIPVVIHPPINGAWRAYCQWYSFQYPPKEYHERDRDVVNASTVLAVLPWHEADLTGDPIKLTGGTGYTLDYARSIGKPAVIICPNGSCVYERWPVELACYIH